MTQEAATPEPSSGRLRPWLVAFAVGVVLADSSVVTLGLPAVLREFDAGVADVAWVLVAFNLVLALCALPAAALVHGRGVGGVWRIGIVLFAAASLACALAPSLGVLVAARCLQAAGGAAVVAAALALLVADRGRAGGTRLWGAAGIVGAAIGPAFGGALTELLSWQAIFAVQVPLVLAILVRPAAAEPASARDGGAPRPPVAVAAALALVSAALTAALFLLVILLTEGWRHSPIEAAAIVSVMPVAALLAVPLSRLTGGGLRGAAAGATMLGGGLVALGLLPGATAGWTIGPQVLVGLGLGLALLALTRIGLGTSGTSDALLRHGAWIIAARHAGVVVGLLLLIPVFTADLDREQVAAQRAGTAKLLDAQLSPRLKVELAGALAQRIEAADGQLPELGAAFRSITPPPAARAAYARLEADLTDEVRRAATHAFSRSFLLAAALALLALLPVAIAGRSVAWGLPLLGALLLSGGVAGAYLALGGGSYRPLAVSDPCETRPWPKVSGLEAVAEQIGLSALDGAACQLRVTREELALAVASADERRRFMREHRLTDGDLEKALRSGAERAIDEAQNGDALTPAQASLARAAVGLVPIGVLIDIVRGAPGGLDQLLGVLGG